MIQKKKIASIDKCYCVSKLNYNGADKILVAAEKIGKCVMFDLDGNVEPINLDGQGGVMTMEQVPNTNGQFLTTQLFFSPNNSADANIIVMTPTKDGKFQSNLLVKLPFVHRFGIFTRNGEDYLLACALKSGHNYKDDWTQDGQVFVGKLEGDLTRYNENNQLSMKLIQDGLHKNHGFFKKQNDGYFSAIVGSESGVFEFTPPKDIKSEWKIEKILDQPTSDMEFVDFEGNGENRLLTFSPFHGDTITIYKKINDTFVKEFEFAEKFPFLHAIGKVVIGEKEVAIVGNRQGERNLMAISFENGKYSYSIIDKDCGSANVLTFKRNDKNVIVAANRETDEVAIYTF
ncbi:MAG: hypothetical protein RR107_07205 [Clostridia bacterium]